MRQHMILCVSACVMIFIAASVRANGDSPTTTADSAINATSTIISLDGQQIMNIRSGYGAVTAAQRANIVRDRLIPILSIPNLTPSDVTVTALHPDQDATIYVRSKQLITVDRALAATDGMTPIVLANRWADSLRQYLPKVNVHPNPDGL